MQNQTDRHNSSPNQRGSQSTGQQKDLGKNTNQKNQDKAKFNSDRQNQEDDRKASEDANDRISQGRDEGQESHQSEGDVADDFN